MKNFKRHLRHYASAMLAVFMFVTAQASGQSSNLEYPPTQRVAHTDTYHGKKVEDPYRWLEEMDAEDTKAWIKAQDRFARERLESIPGRDAIKAHMERARETARVYPPRIRGSRYFFIKLERHKDGTLTRGLFMQEGEAGQPRLIVDAKSHSEDASFAASSGSGVPTFQASPDGRYVAYGIVKGNSSWSEWFVYDVEKQRRLPDVIAGINRRNTATVWWKNDSSGVFYPRYETEKAEDKSGGLRNQKIYFHRLGDKQESDSLIYEKPDQPERTYSCQVTPDERYLIIHAFDSGVQNRVFYKDLSKPDSSVNHVFDSGENIFYFLGVEGSRFLFQTDRNAPHGRVVSVDLREPQEKNWKEVVKEDPDATMISAGLIGNRLLIHYSKDARPTVKIFDRRGKFLHDVELPYIGWITSGFQGRHDDSVAAFQIQGTAFPDSIYLLDINTGKTRPFHQAGTSLNPNDYITRYIFYPGKDGVRIPMFLMHHKGIRPDGKNPVWLYAYGANWSAAPWYQVQHRVWLELGGIYALPAVRGGGEYGDRWMKAGGGVNKQTGIDDYIAAGKWLVEQGYTTPARLVANGGSASGPLVGAAIVQYPELFAAALISYPMTDMLRYDLFTGANSNFGSSRNPEEFEALLKWSPYHNAVAGKCFPPTLISHGNEDSLALTFHSYKFAAALQHAQSCSNPVLLQIAWGMGHTVGGIEERTNQIAFLTKALGIKVPQEWNNE